jgi:hypothetical protein
MEGDRFGMRLFELRMKRCSFCGKRGRARAEHARFAVPLRNRALVEVAFFSRRRASRGTKDKTTI